MAPAAYLVLTFLIVGGATFLTALLLFRLWPAVREERLMVATPEIRPASILREQAPTGWRRTVERLGKGFGTRDKLVLSRYRQRLAWAGYHNPTAATLFLGGKVATAILFGYLYTLYGIMIHRALPNVLLVSFGFAAVGYLLPDFLLRGRIRSRQEKVLNALPDVLDLLMVCVEAGLAFDAAVARVAEQPEVKHSPLHQELLRMHLEVRAGRPREEALHGLGERAGVQEVKAVVAAFIQTNRLGGSIGKTLRVHAETARVQRRHRAEEQGYLAPLKMMFPTVFFLMPSFFLVAMAPSLLGLMQAFKMLGK